MASSKRRLRLKIDDWNTVYEIMTSCLLFLWEPAHHPRAYVFILHCPHPQPSSSGKGDLLVWCPSCLKKRFWNKLYHLESRWRNSHVLVYHGPLLSHLLGVAPSTFSKVYVISQLEITCKQINRLQQHHLLRGSGYLGYVDSNRGYNPYFRGLYVPKS